MLLLPLVAITTSSSDAVTASTSPTISTAFVENRGQWRDEALYRLHDRNFDFWVTRDGLTLDTFRTEKRKRSGQVIKIQFEGANGGSTGTGITQLDGVQNYYRDGNAAVGAQRFESVRVANILKGADVKYYLDGGVPRYDIELAPGTNPDSIVMKYEGVDYLSAKADSVTFGTRYGAVQIKNLFAYQRIDGKVVPVSVQFKSLEGNRVGFGVGAYDPRYKLTIDPQVAVRGSFFGGAQEDYITDGDLIKGERFVVGGITYNSEDTGFPITAGAYNDALLDLNDVFVAEFALEDNNSVSAYPKYKLRFATYISALGNEEDGDYQYPVLVRYRPGGSIAVAFNAEDRLYPVNGSSGVIVTEPPFQSALGSDDVWLGVLDARGGQIYSATRYGGDSSDNPICLDVSGTNIIVAGNTQSDEVGTPFPIVGSKSQAVRKGSNDGFFGIFNAKLTRPSVSTYIGGSGGDGVQGMARSANGSYWLVGRTTSADFPGISSSSFDDTLDTNAGFVSNIGLDGAVNYSTYIGGNGAFTDAARTVAESNGDVYVGGHISGANYSRTGVTSAPLAPTGAIAQYTATGDLDAFVARFNGKLERKVAFTFFGGDSFDSIVSLFAEPTTGRVVVAGESESPSVPVTTGGFPRQSNFEMGFVARMNNGLSTLMHSTMITGEQTAGDAQYYPFRIVSSNDLGNVMVFGYGNANKLDAPENSSLYPVNGIGPDDYDWDGIILEIGYYGDLARAFLARKTISAGGYTGVTAILNLPAQSGGQIVAVSSSDPSIAYPTVSQFTIPAGKSLGAARINAGNTIAVPTTVQINLTARGTTRTVDLKVVP